MRDEPDFNELDRETLVTAHEALVNILEKDLTAMRRDKLMEAEESIADSLDLHMRYEE